MSKWNLYEESPTESPYFQSSCEPFLIKTGVKYELKKLNSRYISTRYVKFEL